MHGLQRQLQQQTTEGKELGAEVGCREVAFVRR
jgi:hypothetical protein